MNAHKFVFALLMLVATAAQAQDSMMVKKPRPKKEAMPTRRGRGTSQPMPNTRPGSAPNPRRNMDKAPIPRDSSRGAMQQDTVR